MEKNAKKKKELRIILPDDAFDRIVKQASVLAQTPSSFGRQVIMEKVILLEAAGSQKDAVKMMDYLKEMEERLNM